MWLSSAHWLILPFGIDYHCMFPASRKPLTPYPAGNMYHTHSLNPLPKGTGFISPFGCHIKQRISGSSCRKFRVSNISVPANDYAPICASPASFYVGNVFIWLKRNMYNEYEACRWIKITSCFTVMEENEGDIFPCILSPDPRNLHLCPCPCPSVWFVNSCTWRSWTRSCIITGPFAKLLPNTTLLLSKEKHLPKES